MTELSPADVSRVALLSRIELQPAEIEQYQKSLNAVLEYVSVLAQVKTDHVQPMVQAVEMTNCLREDVVTESLSTADALKNAPVSDGQYFLVPAVLNH